MPYFVAYYPNTAYDADFSRHKNSRENEKIVPLDKMRPKKVLMSP